MFTRSTLIGLCLIVALCGVGLYALNAFLGRDAQMRSAERDFYIANQDAIEASRKKMLAAQQASRETTTDTVAPAGADDLDDWYAEAGAEDGPMDVSPEDKSYLINDAAPISDGEPIF